MNTDYYNGIKDFLEAMTNYFKEVNDLTPELIDEYKEWVDKVLKKLNVNDKEFMFHVERFLEKL